jgi:hypothetical protein
MYGSVIEIPASPEEFQKFFKHTEKESWLFRGLSVLEKKNDAGNLVWIIFLY